MHRRHSDPASSEQQSMNQTSVWLLELLRSRHSLSSKSSCSHLPKVPELFGRSGSGHVIHTALLNKSNLMSGRITIHDHFRGRSFRIYEPRYWTLLGDSFLTQSRSILSVIKYLEALMLEGNMTAVVYSFSYYDFQKHAPRLQYWKQVE